MAVTSTGAFRLSAPWWLLLVPFVLGTFAIAGGILAIIAAFRAR